MKQYPFAVHTVEGTPTPSDEDIRTSSAQVDRVNAELQAAGVQVFGGGLPPPDSATVVGVEGGATALTDPPVAETKEQLGGFWVIRSAETVHAARK